MNMAQMYFYKFNINSQIYNVYKNPMLQNKILNEVFAAINSEMSYIYGYEEQEQEDDRNIEYKFCDLFKDDEKLRVTGRLVKIYDGEEERYDREKDTVESVFEEDRAASATFYFDLMNEEIAFITRQGFGHLQFGKYFKLLLESAFPEDSFELVLEKNIGQLKERIYGLDRVIKVECEMIPPNANEEEFEMLLGASVDEFKETKATKYIQGMEVSVKGKKTILAKTKFFNRIFYAVGKGYAELKVEGRDKQNQKVTINSDIDAPYKLPIPDKEKDSIPAFRERAEINVAKLLYDKSLVQLENSGGNNEETETISE